MIRITTRLFLLNFALSVAPISHSAIFGDGNPHNGIEDQRATTTSPLLESAGTVICDGAVRGTATLIEHARQDKYSLIVTAAHVLYDLVSGKPYEECSYAPHHQRLSTVTFATVAAHNFNPLEPDKLLQSKTDLVFVLLQYRVEQSARKLDATQNFGDLSLVGYNAELNQLSLSDDCRQFESAQFSSSVLLLHDCDASGGSSGGALFTDGNESLIAIHGGTLFVRHSLPAGSQARPEHWINEARLIDAKFLQQLREFVEQLP